MIELTKDTSIQIFFYCMPNGSKSEPAVSKAPLLSLTTPTNKKNVCGVLAEKAISQQNQAILKS